MIKNKKGIELSVNMLVAIIISLVILGLGVSFLFDLMDKANKLYVDLDTETEKELDRLINMGQKVSLPFNKVSLNGGEEHIFGLGIKNIASIDGFKVNLELSKSIDEENNEIDVDTLNWFKYIKGPYQLKENENVKILLMVKIPKSTPKGRYIFDLKVNKESGNKILYGNKQKIDLTVR
jgi:organic radical activating enzyme